MTRQSTGRSPVFSASAVLDAASRLSHALEDGEITPSEVKDHRKEFEAAYDALGAQLGKLRAVT